MIINISTANRQVGYPPVLFRQIDNKNEIQVNKNKRGYKDLNNIRRLSGI